MREFNTSSNIEDLIKTSIDKVKILMDNKTIFGNPFKIDDKTNIIPISKASVGFVVGGGEYSDKSARRVANHFPMAGGSGCGISVTPIGFIVISDKDVKFVDVENKSLYQTLLNLMNKIISKIDTNSNTSEANNEKKK